MSWAVKEFKSMNLGDPRRKQRAIHLIESLSAKPTASIPQACGDWADTIGAYRFFGNEAVQWEAILAPHIENSVARMAAH
ncbi:transposase, partial [Verminephrobacter aporrectodeae subsp. tuberculatae]|uniref:IS4/Tn5 family transposase DNA-binding protein n=1 Tax=Verminephrobacter aporrectodeae TaxID=1110389 RepID=UPI003908A1A9|nr:transposase [Verminephrobacter aporrectodeae subsp. tuberculatae]